MNHVDVRARVYFNDDVEADDVLNFLKKIEKSIESNLIKQKDKKINLLFIDNFTPLRIDINRILDKPSKKKGHNDK